ncbi:P-loop containing nucleoside triphosphate hydrolase protein [Xylariaceae sp. FL1272]|nr:P-loop containing nucleoside triphosphate hydrolase protein [Xylariaceae sp. FL1272]
MKDSKSNQFLGHGNSSVLSKVDKLREYIGTRIALPQLVVVGDQSSGKSSVLENLTGFAFPRGPDLCTRYATQITCRREQEEGITVSIIPNPDSLPDEQIRAKVFRRTITDTRPETVAHLFRHANEAMGIESSGHTNKSSHLPSAFSEHILKIEKLGPDEEHFTVIDVPGIFRRETEGITKESDIELVMNMVKNYIKDSRTIILAIMPSNVDPATQEILKLARKVDPGMMRTMAIFTKPDLAIEQVTQQRVIDHVLGRRGDLTLGYYVVKNRGADECDKSLEEGQREEQAFFAKKPWLVLTNGKAGIDSVKVRVRKLLIDLIKKEFPKVKSEVTKELQSIREQQHELGPSRSDVLTQRTYLNKISEAFQSLVRDALNAQYTGHEIFADTSLRLITRIMDENDSFAEKMAKDGHMRDFAKSLEGEAQASNKATTRTTETSTDLEKKKDITTELEEVVDQMDTALPRPDGNANIQDYIKELHMSSRGEDLGTFGGALLGSMFKEQSRRWGPITCSYMGQVIYHVHQFISVTIKHLCPDSKVRDELWYGYLLDELFKSYRQAISHAEFLIEIEREQMPYTLNQYFSEQLQKAQSARISQALEKIGQKENRGGVPYVMLQAEQLQQYSVNCANTASTRELMHDVLQSYYSVARKRFVDVIYQQAVKYYLLSGNSSPLKIFSSDMVMNLS